MCTGDNVVVLLPWLADPSLLTVISRGSSTSSTIEPEVDTRIDPKVDTRTHTQTDVSKPGIAGIVVVVGVTGAGYDLPPHVVPLALPPVI